MTAQNLLVEVFVEELPPKALKKLGDAFAQAMYDELSNNDFLEEGARLTAYASPRRLAVHITGVRDVSVPRAQPPRTLMPVSVGWKDGQPTAPLLKKLRGMYSDVVDIAWLLRARVFIDIEGGKEVVKHREGLAAGGLLVFPLGAFIEVALSRLPIPKVMSYQLADGWTTIHFVRPIHGLLVLHGAQIVQAVHLFGHDAGNTTRGHRFEANVDPVVISHADEYAATLLKDGAVIASFAERKAEIARQLAAAAAKVGGGCQPIEDDALLDEVTALVERPNVLICEFEKQFLDVPQECLILTMKANQKYFPLLDAQGKLTNRFLVVSNISPADASAVIGGNERVVRPRLADAKFFFDQDRKKTLTSRVEGLGKVVYHNKLGTQGERMERVRAIARAIGQQLGGDVLAKSADTAAQLAKTDLLTDMVGEFPELQGIMGGYYARHDDLSEDIAFAIEDHYRPRFAGDELPRNMTGVVVALADKLETLVGMFGIGNLPTGDKDPFALRRHALGVIRLLIERGLDLKLPDLVAHAAQTFGARLPDASTSNEQLLQFIYERIAGYLRDSGHSAQDADAVIAVRPAWGEIPQRLAAVRTFAALPEAPALAAANKRIANILKKAEGEGTAAVNESLLTEAAEKDLFAAMQTTVPAANAKFDAGDYTGSLQALAALRAPVDAFFDGVMVNADDPALKANRLGLLRELHNAMNRVADLSRLAT